MSTHQLDTIHLVFKHMATFDYAALEQHVDPRFRHFVRPASLGGFGHPDGFSWDELMSFGKMMQRDIASTEFHKPRELVCETDKIAAWVDSTATTQEGESIRSEHFFIFDFTPSTTKILKVVEMLDSLQVFKVSQQRGTPLPGVDA